MLTAKPLRNPNRRPARSKPQLKGIGSLMSWPEVATQAKSGDLDAVVDDGHSGRPSCAARGEILSLTRSRDVTGEAL
jgi:hypothetical protein